MTVISNKILEGSIDIDRLNIILTPVQWAIAKIDMIIYGNTFWEEIDGKMVWIDPKLVAINFNGKTKERTYYKL